MYLYLITSLVLKIKENCNILYEFKENTLLGPRTCGKDEINGKEGETVSFLPNSQSIFPYSQCFIRSS